MRLNKFIANCGICSRRNAEQLIVQEKISVNGDIVTNLATQIDPDNDIVRYQGNVISINESKEYYLLNKPTQVICTCEDTHGRKTVIDIVKSNSRLYPVGRLDYDSSGLIILTNDGEIANRLAHPSFEIDKEYIAVIKGKLKLSDLEKLRSGVYIDGKITSKAEVEILKQSENSSTLKFIIHEGRNRQIRKMVQAVGSHVFELERTRLGNITTEGLEVGRYRKLEEREIGYLKSI